MRKLTKQSLDELAKVMPVISEDEQRRCVGGTDNSSYYIRATMVKPGTMEVRGITGMEGTAPPATVEKTTMEAAAMEAATMADIPEQYIQQRSIMPW
jgi:hypothetical protein